MLGAALAAFQIGSSVIGGMKAARENKKIENDIKGQLDENEDRFNREYYEDPTKLASAQAMMTAVEDAVLKRNKASAGTQAVMGGTEESVAAAKAANNKMTSDTASKITVAGEQRKQQIENQYLNRKEALKGQLNSLRGQKAQAISGAVQGVGNAVGNIGLALDATAKPAIPDTTPTVNKDFITAQNQAATAAWMDEMAKRYGQSIWDAK